jgi:hypothetical protein
MIKKLFFTAALLVPGLAYGADPSANLPIQIVPAGPAVPAPAVAAGFTTAAINYDFSAPFYATRSNWLDCAGASSPQLWLAWGGFGGNIAGPCSAILQETDPASGLPALHMYWQDGFYNSSKLAQGVHLQTCDSAQPCVGNHIPANAYFEVTARFDSPTPNGTMDLWSYTTNGTSIEWDGIEVWASNTDAGSALHNNENNYNTGIWNATAPPGIPGGIDYTQYHKWAWRVTSNGTSDAFWCSYVDDQPNGCQSWSPTAKELTGLEQILQLSVSMSCRGTTPPCNNGRQINVWISRVRVFSCAGLNSGAKCFTSSANP